MLSALLRRWDACMQAVQDMCAQGLGKSLYGRLEGEVGAHVVRLVSSLVTQTEDPGAFLSLVHSMWTTHCEQMVRVDPNTHRRW